MKSTKKRIEQSLDLVDEKIEATSELTNYLASTVASFMMPKPLSLLDTITKFLKRR